MSGQATKNINNINRKVERKKSAYHPILSPFYEPISNIRVLLEELLHFHRKTTKNDQVLFHILRGTVNNQIAVNKSIQKWLSLNKVCGVQEAQNIINSLEKQGYINKIRKCPNCEFDFTTVPEKCPNCGSELKLACETPNDRRNRPHYMVEITEKGISYVMEIIESFNKTNSFFSKWKVYLLQKSK
jgi:hypothetical protein